MLLNSLVLPNGIWQMQLFQINQNEDRSKMIIMSHTSAAASYISGPLHQRSITTASTLQLQLALLLLELIGINSVIHIGCTMYISLITIMWMLKFSVFWGSKSFIWVLKIFSSFTVVAVITF